MRRFNNVLACIRNIILGCNYTDISDIFLFCGYGGWGKFITSLLVSVAEKYLNKYCANIVSRIAVVYSLVIIHLTFKSFRFCNGCLPKVNSFFF